MLEPAPTGVILAGGRSSRMGRPKALVPLGGVPLVVRVAAVLELVCADLIVVANDPAVAQGLRARTVADDTPHEGPVAGLIAGLAASSRDLCVVVGCDMPLLSEPLLRHMIELGRDPAVEAVAAPCADGRMHPLHTVYRTSCLPSIRGLFEGGERRAIAVLGSLRTRSVDASMLRDLDPRGLSCWSLDTPEDLEAAEALLDGG